MTVMPLAAASWTAIVPTLPPAPRITSVWPALRPRCLSTRNAASPTEMTDAAPSHESPSGLATGWSSRACSLYPPTEAAPKTSSPIAAPAPWPAASTTPATSQPGSTGN